MNDNSTVEELLLNSFKAALSESSWWCGLTQLRSYSELVVELRLKYNPSVFIGHSLPCYNVLKETRNCSQEIIIDFSVQMLWFICSWEIRETWFSL